MLVAYEECGCRAMALLSADDDPGLAREFRAEAEAAGLEVREEQHDAIGAAACDRHAGPRPHPNEAHRR
jgi:hypothetical protein